MNAGFQETVEKQKVQIDAANARANQEADTAQYLKQVLVQTYCSQNGWTKEQAEQAVDDVEKALIDRKEKAAEIAGNYAD